jgi:hypothetical protein
MKVTMWRASFQQQIVLTIWVSHVCMRRVREHMYIMGHRLIKRVYLLSKYNRTKS